MRKRYGCRRYASTLWGGVADLLVTDPPYGVCYVGKTKDALTIENDKLQGDELKEFLVTSLSSAGRHLREGAAFYLFHPPGGIASVFYKAIEESGLRIRQGLVWEKDSMVLGHSDYHYKHEPVVYGWKDGEGHYFTESRKETSVLVFDRPKQNKEHPTMKPVPLIAYLVGNSSKEGDTVLDCFGGSGSTLIACEQLGRKCLTMELDPHYCDVIITRWEELTGKKAVLIDQEM